MKVSAINSNNEEQRDLTSREKTYATVVVIDSKFFNNFVQINPEQIDRYAHIAL